MPQKRAKCHSLSCSHALVRKCTHGMLFKYQHGSCLASLPKLKTRSLNGGNGGHTLPAPLHLDWRKGVTPPQELIQHSQRLVHSLQTGSSGDSSPAPRRW